MSNVSSNSVLCANCSGFAAAKNGLASRHQSSYSIDNEVVVVQADNTIREQHFQGLESIKDKGPVPYEPIYAQTAEQTERKNSGKRRQRQDRIKVTKVNLTSVKNHSKIQDMPKVNSSGPSQPTTGTTLKHRSHQSQDLQSKVSQVLQQPVLANISKRVAPKRTQLMLRQLSTNSHCTSGAVSSRETPKVYSARSPTGNHVRRTTTSQKSQSPLGSM